MVAESATQITPPTASANRGIASASDVDLHSRSWIGRTVALHNACEHLTEAKVHYPFHPGFGDTVIVRRCLRTNGIEMAVVYRPVYAADLPRQRPTQQAVYRSMVEMG
jgi:hypothetical protein